MAISTALVPTVLVPQPLQPGRVVRELGAAPGTPAAAPPPAPIDIGPARSQFWQNRIDTYALANQLLQGVSALQAMANTVHGDLQAIAAINSLQVTTNQSAADFNQASAAVQALQTLAGRTLPDTFNVSAALAPAEAAQFERAVDALESLAECCEQRGCGDLDDMSDLAFVCVAHIAFIAGQLMDLQNVTFESVKAKLSGSLIQGALKGLEGQLANVDDDAATDALQFVIAATDLASFEELAPAGTVPDDAVLFDELRHRAALLVAAQCLIAGKVEGDSDEWPPAPSTSGGTVAASRRVRKSAR